MDKVYLKRACNFHLSMSCEHCNKQEQCYQDVSQTALNKIYCALNLEKHYSQVDKKGSKVGYFQDPVWVIWDQKDY